MDVAAKTGTLQEGQVVQKMDVEEVGVSHGRVSALVRVTSVRKATIGRMGGEQAGGPGGMCYCPGCGYEEPHETGEPCDDKTCAECGAQMDRKAEAGKAISVRLRKARADRRAIVGWFSGPHGRAIPIRVGPPESEDPTEAHVQWDGQELLLRHDDFREMLHGPENLFEDFCDKLKAMSEEKATREVFKRIEEVAEAQVEEEGAFNEEAEWWLDHDRQTREDAASIIAQQIQQDMFAEWQRREMPVAKAAYDAGWRDGVREAQDMYQDLTKQRGFFTDPSGRVRPLRTGRREPSVEGEAETGAAPGAAPRQPLMASFALSRDANPERVRFIDADGTAYGVERPVKGVDHGVFLRKAAPEWVKAYAIKAGFSSIDEMVADDEAATYAQMPAAFIREQGAVRFRAWADEFAIHTEVPITSAQASQLRHLLKFSVDESGAALYFDALGQSGQARPLTKMTLGQALRLMRGSTGKSVVHISMEDGIAKVVWEEAAMLAKAGPAAREVAAFFTDPGGRVRPISGQAGLRTRQSQRRLPGGLPSGEEKRKPVVGDRIYDQGDRANPPRYGTILAVGEPEAPPHHMQVEWEEAGEMAGHEFPARTSVTPLVVLGDVGSRHLGRFVYADEHEAWREKQLRLLTESRGRARGEGEGEAGKASTAPTLDDIAKAHPGEDAQALWAEQCRAHNEDLAKRLTDDGWSAEQVAETFDEVYNITTDGALTLTEKGSQLWIDVHTG